MWSVEEAEKFWREIVDEKNRLILKVNLLVKDENLTKSETIDKIAELMDEHLHQ